MKKITRLISYILCLTAALFLFSGCGSKLPDAFEESQVEEQAKNDITLAQSNDFEGWKARFSEALQPNITEDVYGTYLQALDERGAFQGFGKCAVTGQEQDGSQYAIVLIVGEYENGDLQYTLSYDTQMNLINFLIK